MLIVVEGPDNSGKSTQIINIWKQVANQDKLPIWLHYANVGIKNTDECIQYSEKLYDHLFQHYSDTIKLTSDVVMICDRGPYGEWVYGKRYRDYDANFIWEIEEKYKNDFNFWDDTYLLTFVDDPENLIWRDDGLSFSTDLEDKRWEVNRFLEAHLMSKIENKLAIDIDGKDAVAVWSEVKEFLWPEST
jgi:hypothetical protein